MDPILNPFAPNLSAPPPQFAGREGILQEARMLLQRQKAGRSEKSLLIQGLRGSGKTALLQALAALTRAEGSRAWYGPDALEAVESNREPGLLLADDAHRLGPAALKSLIDAHEQRFSQGRPQALVLLGEPFLGAMDDRLHAQASRLFHIHTLGPLDADELRAALQGPAKAAGAAFDDDALKDIHRLSRGHPIAVQAWAHEAWAQAKGTVITRDAVRDCGDAVTQRLDRDYYGPGYERLTPREKAYLRTMAHLGPGPHRSGDIADSMDAKITSLGPLRAKLMAQGWVYSPEHGWLGFTMPGFDEFMRRVMPGFR